jgi:hypothetical protein
MPVDRVDFDESKNFVKQIVCPTDERNNLAFMPWYCTGGIESCYYTFQNIFKRSNPVMGSQSGCNANILIKSAFTGDYVDDVTPVVS